MILGLETSHNSSTAILYFTRSVESEARRKSLIPNNYKKNKQVVKALIDHTKHVISNSGLTYYISNTDSDTLSFGEKLTRNIDYVFAQGHNSIIILGNDCPQLNEADINKAADILHAGHDTYGRATDGGLYLIGLQQESYHKAIFEKLSWSDETLAEDLDKYLATYSREIHCVASSIKEDIDDNLDLISFIGQASKSCTLYHKIISILIDYTQPRVFELHIIHQNTHLKTANLRGPPQAA